MLDTLHIFIIKKLLKGIKSTLISVAGGNASSSVDQLMQVPGERIITR